MASRMHATILLMTCFVLLAQCAKLENTEEKGNDLITETCKNTLHSQTCISSLTSVPGSNTADPKGLAKIAINVTLAEGSKILAYVHELKSSDESKKSDISSVLNDCDEEYTEAMENLKESATALDKGDYKKVNMLLSTAMTNGNTCEEGFKDLEITSPLTKRNSYFSELCSNVLAITKLLA
ncbi:hypothetical protein TanjilG_29188 [Lupinus angustifolius]|uniref:Pectinesterase inhibitor domain-containing protein n=1 Tax=Lupinus angustifolius TaxID=3871 RepID=A0A1J7GIJ3_LUPAN|nr:PREDICTED: putative invertase inhibitor [Lupinus angustifolius]OIW00198.1 hypothetical protein TanjilG_29188 [Lupinus angustifolius]